MAKQTINIGTTPNDGTGDALRNAFDKTNSNFTELYDGKQDDLVSGTNIKTVNGNSLLGSGNLAIAGLSNFIESESTTAPNATVYVDSLRAAASTTNADVAIVPKGTGAFMLDIPDGTTTGGNKRGANAIDLQNSRGAAIHVASGANSIVIGSGNRASGNGDSAIGINNSCTSQSGNNYAFGNSNNLTGDSNIFAVGVNATITGYAAYCLGNGNGISGINGSTAIGTGHTVSGNGALAVGNYNTANATWAFVFGGQGSNFGVQHRQVYGGGQIGTIGDAQKSLFILKQRTTSNTATTLTVNNSGTADTSNQVILSNNSSYRFKGTIIGKRSGTTDVAAWDVDGLIVRGANAASTTLLISTVNVVQNTPAWGTPTLAADTTNGGLRIQVTGAATTNIQWTGTIETTEVIYA